MQWGQSFSCLGGRALGTCFHVYVVYVALLNCTLNNAEFYVYLLQFRNFKNKLYGTRQAQRAGRVRLEPPGLCAWNLGSIPAAWWGS